MNEWMSEWLWNLFYLITEQASSSSETYAVALKVGIDLFKKKKKKKKTFIDPTGEEIYKHLYIYHLPDN